MKAWVFYHATILEPIIIINRTASKPENNNRALNLQRHSLFAQVPETVTSALIQWQPNFNFQLYLFSNTSLKYKSEYSETTNNDRQMYGRPKHQLRPPIKERPFHLRLWIAYFQIHKCNWLQIQIFRMPKCLIFLGRDSTTHSHTRRQQPLIYCSVPEIMITTTTTKTTAG